MNPGGRLWRVDLAAILVATVVVGVFVLTMAVEQILPDIGGGQRVSQARGTVPRPDCDKGRLALTFDGGPDPEVTGPLLDALRDERVVATFFVSPDRLEAGIPTVQRMLAAGHQVGLHLPAMPPGPMRRLALAHARDLFIRNGLGVPKLVRPANDVADEDLRTVIGEIGMTLATDPGALDVGDLHPTIPAPRTIQAHILDGVEQHKVLVAHDQGVGGLNTVAALGPTVDELHRRGYCFARFDDVRDGRGVIVVSGEDAS